MQELIEIDIEKFNDKGDGVGRLKSAPFSKVYIPHAILGDKIEAFVSRKKRRGYLKARISKILLSSPLRTPSRCTHAEICGGCTWQEIIYEKQLELKQKKILSEFSYLNLDNILQPIISCDEPFHYRNKMEFSFSENGAKTKFLGLMIAAANKYVFNVNRCHLCSDWISSVLLAIKEWWERSDLKAYDFNKDSGTLRYVTFREGKRTSQKMVILTVSSKESLSSLQIDTFVTSIRSVVSDISIILREQKIEPKKPTEFIEKTLYNNPYIFEKMHILSKTLNFKISPFSFFQPNTFQAEKLYSLAINLSQVKKDDLVLDLFSGTGTIGLIFSFFAKKVIGIEINPQSVIDGNENIILNNIKNFELISGDVKDLLHTLPTPDILILDPPRSGLDPSSIEQIKKMRPKKIIYISCNPKTQALNLKEFLSDYTLKIMQPVDQFPHTIHIENIALLEIS